MTLSAGARIALVPLDERPVNTGLVSDVAAIAGLRLALPPADLLPVFRAPAPTTRVSEWLLRQAEREDTAAVVVSIDTLVHGGLIAARTSDDTLESVVARLGALREVKDRHPRLPLHAVSLVTRASDSYSNVEEPRYWDRFGRELHRLGASAHRSWRHGSESPAVTIPDEVRSDFARRRLRNHVINLSAVALAADGVLDTLVITADDTAEHSAGSAEQDWLTYWGLLDAGLDLPAYPGADETGAVLVARTLCDLAGLHPRVRVLTGDASGWDRIPPYENEPLSQSVPRQARAAGALVTEGSDADLMLVIHPSDIARADQFGPVEPTPDHATVAATVQAVVRGLDHGLPVALADLRYSNGADPVLMEELESAGLLDRLSAYAGWNTAGNALGSALALGVATVVGRARGTFDASAARRSLTRRYLDDWIYQAEVRREMRSEYFADRIDPLPAPMVDRAESAILDRLRAASTRLGTTPVVGVELPWKRSFEVDIRLDGDVPD